MHLVFATNPSHLILVTPPVQFLMEKLPSSWALLAEVIQLILWILLVYLHWVEYSTVSQAQYSIVVPARITKLPPSWVPIAEVYEAVAKFLRVISCILCMQRLWPYWERSSSLPLRLPSSFRTFCQQPCFPQPIPHQIHSLLEQFFPPPQNLHKYVLYAQTLIFINPIIKKTVTIIFIIFTSSLSNIFLILMNLSP